MSLHNVPSIMDIYSTFPFQRDHLTLDTKHPTAQSIRTLRGGLLRNSKTQASTRGGCQAVEVAHKFLVMTKDEWEAGQTQYMDEEYTLVPSPGMWQGYQAPLLCKSNGRIPTTRSYPTGQIFERWTNPVPKIFSCARRIHDP